jgi:cytochrome P450
MAGHSDKKVINMLFLTGIFVALLFVVIIAYLWHIQKAYDFFIRLNIPGPPPMLFFGNFLEIIKTKGPSLAIKKWTDKYGHIFGYFEGHTPILVISNPDILQDVFIKSFSNFHSRRESPFVNPHAKEVSVFSAVGFRWKRQRFVLNPTFSSLKLKQMLPLVHRSIEILMTKMAEQCNTNESFDIFAYFKRFTMDTIWSCAFGLDTDMQNNVNDPYLINSQQHFRRTTVRRIVFILTILLSELSKVWASIFLLLSLVQYFLRRYVPGMKWFIAESPIIWTLKQAHGMIEKRKEICRTQRTDLLQLMLESEFDKDFIQVSYSFD